MTEIYAAICIAILVVMAIALVRASYAPTVYDRILGVNMFGTKTVLFIAVTGYLMGRPEFLDIAIDVFTQTHMMPDSISTTISQLENQPSYRDQ